MNWTVSWMAWGYMAIGALLMAVIFVWAHVGDLIQRRWGYRWAIAYALSTFVVIPPTALGLLL